MPDHGLSLEEIDALMGGDDNNDILTSEQKDALGEIGNISFGNSATALSELLKNKTEINTPTVTITSHSEIEEEFSVPYVVAKVDYVDGLTGENLLIIDMKDAAIIADLMMDGDGKSVDGKKVGELELSAVQEAMNQMMGKSATSMSLMLNKKVDISTPVIKILDINNDEGREFIPDHDTLVKIAFRLTIGELIDSEIMMLLNIDFAIELADQVIESSQVIEEEPKEESSPVSKSIVSERTHVTQLPPKPVENKKTAPVSAPVQTVTFADFNPAPSNEGVNGLELLYDIPLDVSVLLGRAQRKVKDVLSLNPGSIIELDRLAGEHVDILVNNKLIARGEVVVIEENFGVRVTDILSPQERMKKLR